jgi:SOS regulatory protein LexA
LIGTVTAGLPMLAEENIERYIAVPRSLLRSGDPHFLLRVTGDSMTGAGILPNDLVVVRSQQDAEPGDVVVALIHGEATVKRLAVTATQRYLKAENPRMRIFIRRGNGVCRARWWRWCARRWSRDPASKDFVQQQLNFIWVVNSIACSFG